MARTTNVSFSLTHEAVARLDEMAKAADTSRSWMLRRLLEAVLNTETTQLPLVKPQQQQAA